MISQSRAIRSRTRKNVKFVKIMTQTYYGSTCDLTNIQALLYGSKTAARPFDTIQNILRSLRLAHSLLRANLDMRNREVKLKIRIIQN